MTKPEASRFPARPSARRHRGLVGVLALSLLAAACGSESHEALPGTAAGGADPSPAEGAAARVAYPVTIEHAYGSTEIESEPGRVVSLGYTEQDAIVLFGVQPVGVRYAFGPEDDPYFPWADDAAGDSDPEVLARAEVNVEQIATLRPDLIMAVTAGLTEEEYDTLSKIAPVVVQPEEFAAFTTPWDEQTLVTGRALGQEAKAEEVVADVREQIEDAVDAHPELDGLSLALSGPAHDGQYPFHASGDARTRFFTDLGMVVPAELDEIAGQEFYGALSKERADLLDTDVLLFQSGSVAEKAGIEDDAVLQALPVVEDGRSLFVEGDDYDALQFMSALSVPYLLESLVPKLAAIAG